jgi:predicted transcriptional regulator
MTANEQAILTMFRRYQAGPAQMLFFNPAECKLSVGRFQAAMHSLIEQGLVIKERPKQAYSLTSRGYGLARTIEQPVGR